MSSLRLWLNAAYVQKDIAVKGWGAMDALANSGFILYLCVTEWFPT